MKEYIIAEDERGYEKTIGELIRCKDCKHCMTYRQDRYCGILFDDFDTCLSVSETDYCSRAERKES